MAKVLLLRLEGPLQSWGQRGRWTVRDTALQPTKSGVVGLLACALGWAEDAQIRSLSEQIKMAVRVDASGTVMTDYHTIGGGYDKPQLLTAEGKPKLSSGRPHTEISNRDYLCSASFVVALYVENALAAQLASALDDPKWPIFLGRKSCPPATPILLRTIDAASDVSAALETALRSVWPSAYRSEANGNYTFVFESAHGVGAAVRDEVISRKYRTYGTRYVDRKQIELTFAEAKS